MSNPVYTKQSNPSLTKYLGIVALLFLVFLLGWKAGETQQKTNESIEEKTMRDPYGNNALVNMETFWETWNIINGQYVDPHELDAKQMVYGATAGMVYAVGDPYTVFMTPKESKEFNEEVEGEFEGIGIEITLKDNLLTVVSPLKDSPAKKAGLQPEDVIVMIEEEPTEALTLEEAARMIRGPKGTEVNLAIFREGADDLLKIAVERNEIKVNSVEWSFVGDEIALIEVNRFNNETMSEFNAMVSEVLNQQAKGIILDLRFNSGGILESSTEMASVFLEGKQKKLVTIKKRNNEDDEVIYASGQGRLANLPMVVLINGGSASASEIVAGALQDYERATIVGEQSFGKGTVQAVESLSGGASLRITIAKWFTPNDINISENGITPDVEVEMTLEDYQNDLDPQLDKALEILGGEV